MPSDPVETVRQLNELVARLRHQKHFEEALPYAEQIFRIIAAEEGGFRPEYVLSLRKSTHRANRGR
jgi:hypothetical protein